MISYESLFLAFLLPLLLLVTGGLLLLWIAKSSYEQSLREQVEAQARRLSLRQRTQMAEKTMAQAMTELGWPKAAQKMTTTKMSRQLYSLISVRIRSEVDAH